MGNTLYLHIGCDRNNGRLIIVFEDVMGENSLDIPEKVYNGKWKGIRVHGSEFGHALSIEMGVRHYLDLLEVTPEIHLKNGIMVVRLDEVKRSTAEITKVQIFFFHSGNTMSCVRKICLMKAVNDKNPESPPMPLAIA